MAITRLRVQNSAYKHVWTPKNPLSSGFFDLQNYLLRYQIEKFNKLAKLTQRI